jgi:hypothetical protein
MLVRPQSANFPYGVFLLKTSAVNYGTSRV